MSHIRYLSVELGDVDHGNRFDGGDDVMMEEIKDKDKWKIIGYLCNGRTGITIMEVRIDIIMYYHHKHIKNIYLFRVLSYFFFGRDYKTEWRDEIFSS